MIFSRAETASPGSQGPLGNATSPAPSVQQWLIGGGIAMLLHVIVAWPFLPKPEPEPEPVVLEETGPEIGVRLAPIVQPPEQDTPPPEPEIQPETPVIEERADDSPPPAPPREPRRIPDIPDITPKAVPEIWTGGAGSGGSEMTLEEYLFLQDWLKAARAAVLERLAYPDEARRRYMTGNAKVVIVADRQGKIIEYRFLTRTGHVLLDREIERTIKSIRRLPPFPDGTRYDTLSYLVTIRFELVGADGMVMAAAEVEESRKQIEQTGLPVEGTMTTERIAKCAASAGILVSERDAITAERERLEQLREEYIAEAERYQRRRQAVPKRIDRLRVDYERDAESFGSRIDAYNERSDAYQALCSGGSSTYEDYAAACRPYLTSGNAYCEAFGTFWARLKAEQ